jgi:predicted transcriptional regulator
MSETQQIDKGELLALTSEIVSSHIANNSVEKGDVTDLIQSVFNKLADLAGGEEAKKQDLVPAVPVKKSVTPDYIVCLEDGKKLKMLKRHLMTSYGLTPDDYRAKWGLPSDYPMVAPNYAAKRQELAKKIGLGRKPKTAAAATKAAPAKKAPAKKSSTKKQTAKG